MNILGGPNYRFLCLNRSLLCLCAATSAAQRHGISSISNHHSLFCSESRVAGVGSGSRDCAVQRSQRQAGEKQFQYLVHLGESPSTYFYASRSICLSCCFWERGMPVDTCDSCINENRRMPRRSRRKRWRRRALLHAVLIREFDDDEFRVFTVLIAQRSRTILCSSLN